MKFIELSRSNYFRVTSRSAFNAICVSYGLRPLAPQSGAKRGEVSFVISDGKSTKGESIHSFKKELAAILEDGEVCIVRTIGFVQDSIEELHGKTIAFNSSGEEIVIDLDDVYGQVEEEWDASASPVEE